MATAALRKRLNMPEGLPRTKQTSYRSTGFVTEEEARAQMAKDEEDEEDEGDQDEDDDNGGGRGGC